MESRGELAILIELTVDNEPQIVGYRPWGTEDEQNLEIERQVFAGKKYKPVDQKVRPIRGTLPEEFRIIREIKGEPLGGYAET